MQLILTPAEVTNLSPLASKVYGHLAAGDVLKDQFDDNQWYMLCDERYGPGLPSALTEILGIKGA